MHFLSFYLSRLRKKTKSKVKVTNQLIRQILPSEYTSKLIRYFKDDKNHGFYYREKLKNAIFCQIDLVNFCQKSRCYSPRTLVRVLDTIFTQFDVLSSKYGFIKAKTEGDAYICLKKGSAKGSTNRERYEEEYDDDNCFTDREQPNDDEANTRMDIVISCLFSLELLISLNRVNETSKEILEPFQGRVGLCSSDGVIILLSDDESLVRFDVHGKGMKQVTFLEQNAMCQSICIDRKIYDELRIYDISFERRNDNTRIFRDRYVHDDFDLKERESDDDDDCEVEFKTSIEEEEEEEQELTRVEVIEIFHDDVSEEEEEEEDTEEARGEIVQHFELGEIETFQIRNPEEQFENLSACLQSLPMDIPSPFNKKRGTNEEELEKKSFRSTKSHLSQYYCRQSDPNGLVKRRRKKKKLLVPRKCSCFMKNICECCFMCYPKLLLSLFSFIFDIPKSFKFIFINLDHISLKTFMLSWIVMFFMCSRVIALHCFSYHEMSEMIVFLSFACFFMFFVVLIVFSMQFCLDYYCLRRRNVHQLKTGVNMGSENSVKYSSTSCAWDILRHYFLVSTYVVLNFWYLFFEFMMILFGDEVRVMNIYSTVFILVIYQKESYYGISGLVPMSFVFVYKLIWCGGGDIYRGLFVPLIMTLIFVISSWNSNKLLIKYYSERKLYEKEIANYHSIEGKNMLVIGSIVPPEVVDDFVNRFRKEKCLIYTIHGCVCFVEIHCKPLSYISPSQTPSSSQLNILENSNDRNTMLSVSYNNNNNDESIKNNIEHSDDDNESVVDDDDEDVEEKEKEVFEEEIECIDRLNEVFNILDTCCIRSNCQKIRTSSNKFIAVSGDLFKEFDPKSSCVGSEDWDSWSNYSSDDNSDTDSNGSDDNYINNNALNISDYDPNDPNNLTNDNDEFQRDDEFRYLSGRSQLFRVYRYMENMARFTLITKLELSKLTNMKFKIGFCFGEFTAGIIGAVNFTFDVIGESVNLSSRCCTTNTEWNQIQFCGKKLHERLRGIHNVRALGEKQLKGFGNRSMYILEK